MEFIRSRMLCLGFVMLVFVNVSTAQTYAEIFRQKKTQKKYLLEQLAALKVYAGYLKKGYDIASTGLNAVRGFSKGEFDLHHTFISSLKTVSPVIKSNTKVAEIIVMQLEISRAFGNINTTHLGSAALGYINEVKSSLVQDCETDLEELLLVVTSGKVEMKDDERLKRIDGIYERMRDKRAFVQSFCGEVNLMNVQRKREKQSIDQLKRLYESN